MTGARRRRIFHLTIVATACFSSSFPFPSSCWLSKLDPDESLSPRIRIIDVDADESVGNKRERSGVGSSMASKDWVRNVRTVDHHTTNVHWHATVRDDKESQQFITFTRRSCNQSHPALTEYVSWFSNNHACAELIFVRTPWIPFPST